MSPRKGKTRPFRPGSCFGVNTVGSLGGELAQRQAALREVMAAGSRVGSCLPTKGRARRVPLRKDFLEKRVDSFWTLECGNLLPLFVCELVVRRQKRRQVCALQNLYLGRWRCQRRWRRCWPVNWRRLSLLTCGCRGSLRADPTTKHNSEGEEDYRDDQRTK